LGPEEVLW